MHWERASWPHGPWDNEPDYAEFMHAELFCAVVRHKELGHLNGYVGVTRGHPWFEMPYLAIEARIHIHGGITFSGYFSALGLPQESQFPLDEIWWFGFDTAHYPDFQPGIYVLQCMINPRRVESTWEAECVRLRATYRDFSYVRQEAVIMAEQIASITTETDRKNKSATFVSDRIAEHGYGPHQVKER